MAESLTDALKEELTCMICTELLHNPVALPCQHSFCRDCMETYITSSEKTKKAKSADCPTCRSTFQLEKKGASSLPRHFILANIVEKYQTEVNQGRILCSVCQADPAYKAIKTCLSCKLSYCAECVNLRHPLVGAFADHKLVKPTVISTDPTCADHDEPLKLFCVDCHRPICYLCDRVGMHREHVASDLKAAFQDCKKSLQAKVDKLQSTLSQGDWTLDSLKDSAELEKSCLKAKIEKCDKGFREIQTRIEEKRTNMVELLKEGSRQHQEETDRNLVPLSSGIAGARNCLEVTKESIKETDVTGFLMSSLLISQRIDKEMSNLNSLLCSTPRGKKGPDKPTGTRVQEKQLELYVIQVDKHNGGIVMYPTCMYRDQMIQCPELFFDKRSANKSVTIDDDCKEFSNRKGIGGRQLSGAEVSSSFIKGVMYYEAEVSFAIRKKIDRQSFLFSAGILQKSQSDPRFLGQDNSSWGFLIEKRHEVTIVAMHNDRASSVHSLPSYQDPSKWTVRFGFLLDCENCKFSVLEITNDYVIHTFRLPCQGMSFAPAFATYNFNQVEATVSLKTRGEISELPMALLNKIGAV